MKVRSQARSNVHVVIETVMPAGKRLLKENRVPEYITRYRQGETTYEILLVVIRLRKVRDVKASRIVATVLSANIM